VSCCCPHSRRHVASCERLTRASVRVCGQN
jgi:hypothetical protein